MKPAFLKSAGSALAVALALLATTAASAQPMERPTGDLTRAQFLERASEIFARMDLTRDGQLDSADRTAKQGERFREHDTDGNGELSKAEMQAAHEARKAKMAERRKAREGQAGDRLDQHFAKLDKDGSGGVSQTEMATARDMRGERGGERGPRGDRGEGRGHHTDDRKNGAHGKKMWHGLARQADANQDRIVTRAEFDSGVAAHFSRIDANGDGVATEAERQAARAAMRAQRKGQRGASQ